MNSARKGAIAHINKMEAFRGTESWATLCWKWSSLNCASASLLPQCACGNDLFHTNDHVKKNVKSSAVQLMDPSTTDIEEARASVPTALGCPSDSSIAGKADVCRGCPGRELCLSQAGSDEDQKYIDVRMNVIKRKILILSGKGGVGKSSVAAGLSLALSMATTKVGIIDLDICGPSVPKLLGVQGQSIVTSQYGWVPIRSPLGSVKVMSVGSLLEESDSAVVWRGPRKTALIKRFLKDTFWGRLDYLIFDTPPGTSDEHLTVVKSLMNARPEGAIIVTTPQEMALATIRKEINFCRKMKIEILGIVENMSGFVCPCCKECWSLFSEGGAQKLCQETSLPLLGTIPLDPELVRCCEGGLNIFDEKPDSPAANALLQLANTIRLPP